MHLPSNYASAFIFSVVIVLCTIIWWWWYRKCIAAYKDIPSVPIFKILKITLLARTPKGIPRASFLFQRLIESIKEYQSDEGILYCWIFQRCLLITGQAAFKFFSKEASERKADNYDLFKEIFGNGLGLINDDAWKKQRKMLNPVFKVSVLKDKVSIINKNADILVEELMNLPKEESLNIHEHIKFCGFSNVYEYILDLDATERKRELERVIYLLHAISDEIMIRSFHPLTRYKITQYFFSSGRKYIKNLQELRLSMKKILLEMKESTLSRQKNKEVDETNECRSAASGSFAQILVERHLKDESFTLDYMADELCLFLIGGYETVSLTMMYCVFLLGNHKEAQDKVYNELQSVMDKNYLSFDDMAKLTYLDAVIKETLRLYPAIPIYGRHLEKPVQFGKYNIPKDTTIIFCPYQYHRDPKYFPDPEKFVPERFLEVNAENRPLIFPFAEGARNCIGKKFAMMEMKIVLAHLLRNFKVISLIKKEDINLNWTASLSTVKPIYVRLSHRQKGIPVK